MHLQYELSLCFLLFLLSSSFNVSNADSGLQNPFTAKASLIRYWNRQISNTLPKPSFLLSKASPLTAIQLATLTKLADQNALSTHLESFCSSANLLCPTKSSPSLGRQSHDSVFSTYSNRNFTDYGTNRLGGLSSFKNYSDEDNLPVDSFKRYSRSSSNHRDQFSNYSPEGNVVDDSFTAYGTSSSLGSSIFKAYESEVNSPELRFTSYNTDTNMRTGLFKGYSESANAGTQAFVSYGRNSNAVPSDFSNYGTDSNTIESRFTTYSKTSNGANDSFTSYGSNGNVPTNNFVSYGSGGNGANERFSSYREQANTGDDSFNSYVKTSNSEKAIFTNYGKSLNQGTDTFQGYGKGSVNQDVAFKIYGLNTTFKDYSRKGISFASYTDPSTSPKKSFVAKSNTLANKWVEPGKFFREAMLRKGTVMPMPDIRDKMPKRSFLPRSISSKLPSTTNKLAQIFHAEQNSSMARMINNTLEECERKPSQGETKMCVRSIEDMIDFAVSVLGRNLTVRSTESVTGSKKDVMIGSVKGINGGKATKSVSCHQSLFPSLMYYCHSVPKVRVYEAEIMDIDSKRKINKGIAICHLDTSAWNPSHGAFLALGSIPGQIEVCHWIFENDMTWTTAD